MHIEGYSFESIKGEGIFWILKIFQKLFRLIFLRIPNGSTVDGSEIDSNESNYVSTNIFCLNRSYIYYEYELDLYDR